MGKLEWKGICDKRCKSICAMKLKTGEGVVGGGVGILDVNFSLEIQLIKLLMSIFQFD